MWMDGRWKWIDEWIDEWDGWVSGRGKEKWMDGWMDIWSEKKIKKCKTEEQVVCKGKGNTQRKGGNQSIKR